MTRRGSGSAPQQASSPQGASTTDDDAEEDDGAEEEEDDKIGKTLNMLVVSLVVAILSLLIKMLVFNTR